MHDLINADERFTVQWDRVRVVDHIEDGEFTFQVSLFRNGSIHFAYRDVSHTQSKSRTPHVLQRH